MANECCIVDHLDEKMRYRSENVSTHSRYTLETYFWAVIWLCLWQKVLPPTKLSYSN